ncbi:amidohydrolase 2 [Pseudomonas putida S11]|nr:amidohydrolase 2 [Pseudomonas putida S11]
MIVRALACVLLSTWLCQAAQARDYRYSDAHLHYVDFFQESEGMPALIKAMDAAGIEQSMISGVPVAKKWHEDEPKRPRYYAGDDAEAYWYSATDTYVAAALQQLPDEQRKRFHPFLAGFNPVDKNAASHIERMLDLHPGLWQGIGEVFTRHDDLTALTSGDTPRANNEAMARIYHLAAERDLPVLLHSNITSKRERNPLYLAEIEEPLRNHPHTRFIWAHAGSSMEIHRHQTQMDFSAAGADAVIGGLPEPVCRFVVERAENPICWMTRVYRARRGWHWSRGSRNGSCWVRMWWGGLVALGSRCMGSGRFWMHCRNKLRIRWPGRIFWMCCPSNSISPVPALSRVKPAPTGVALLLKPVLYLWERARPRRGRYRQHK